ncbi:uncharacterized protein LOC113796625 [Dermatophagoides pteronyssinus]|uniref:uncharacterized protein LOC113796625 n=1 Tax=Dermatophagoides pteronyssinus TaxID=6956 RepID=UPI003F66D310
MGHTERERKRTRGRRRRERRKPPSPPPPKRVASDAPTAIIAPEDYEHIYSAKKQPNKTIKMRAAKGGGQQPNLAKVPSDAPTAIIAPEDYEHIYCATKKQPKVTNDNNADLKIRSDDPTALIAPEDYAHIYSNRKKLIPGKVGFGAQPAAATPPAPLQIRSDDPTALIAPDDYEHIFSKRKEAVKKIQPPRGLPPRTKQSPTRMMEQMRQNMPAPEEYQQFYKVAKNVVENLKIDSDTPTALIAPEDYEHIFKRTQVQTKRAPPKQQQKNVEQLDFPSDAPTALIAPDDYEHIYKRQPKEQTKTITRKQQRPRTQFQQQQQRTKLEIPSDAPTALIAPDDYEHIYKRQPKEQTRPTTRKQHHPRTQFQQQRTKLEIPSDAPTALIAPDDYEHIYKRQEKEQTPKKQRTPKRRQTPEQMKRSPPKSPKLQSQYQPQLIQDGKLMIDINDPGQLLQLLRMIQTLQKSLNISDQPEPQSEQQPEPSVNPFEDLPNNYAYDNNDPYDEQSTRRKYSRKR